MRETIKPRQLKFSSLEWLVNFLNLKIESQKSADKKRVDQSLGYSWPPDDIPTMAKAQQKIVDLVDLALKANSPEGLVWSLNDYIADNSETFDPRRQHPPVRPHWYVRRYEDVRFINATWALLNMGSRKWVVHPGHLMHGTEGKAWLCIIQSLENGEFGRLRRCLLGHCQRFFESDDARQKFCNRKHQREYDRAASKARVKDSRERQKAKTLGRAPSAGKPKETPTISITEERRFAEFLTAARSNVIPGSDLALFIKRKINGDWKTVTKWLADSRSPTEIWASLGAKTKDAFRTDLWKQSR